MGNDPIFIFNNSIEIKPAYNKLHIESIQFDQF